MAGDWDYLALDQLYLPQYCRDLEAGIDDAVTHQHVDTYPKGVQCIPGRVQNALTIHGLWPGTSCAARVRQKGRRALYIR